MASLVLAAGLLALATPAAGVAGTAAIAHSGPHISTPRSPITVVDNDHDGSNGFDWNALFSAGGAIGGAAVGFVGAQLGASKQAKRERDERRSADIRAFLDACGQVMVALAPFGPASPTEPSDSNITDLTDAIGRAGSLQPWIYDPALSKESATLLHAASAVPRVRTDQRATLLKQAADAMNALSARAGEIDRDLDEGRKAA
jgi:hypothetical protein